MAPSPDAVGARGRAVEPFDRLLAAAAPSTGLARVLRASIVAAASDPAATTDAAAPAYDAVAHDILLTFFHAWKVREAARHGETREDRGKPRKHWLSRVFVGLSEWWE